MLRDPWERIECLRERRLGRRSLGIQLVVVVADFLSPIGQHGAPPRGARRPKRITLPLSCGALLDIRRIAP